MPSLSFPSLLFSLCLTGGLAACTAANTANTANTVPPALQVGMANPASVHCLQAGGQLSRHKDQAGNEYGLCRLPDGRQVEEWALFRQDQPH